VRKGSKDRPSSGSGLAHGSIPQSPQQVPKLKQWALSGTSPREWPLAFLGDLLGYAALTFEQSKARGWTW
jgi:hypothetical protein